MRIKNIFIGLLLLAPLQVLSEGEKRSQFIGTWCSNPCAFGTTSRPWNLPCSFVVSEGAILWAQRDDNSKKFVRKYVVLEQKEGEETLLVYGGSARSWYDHNSSRDAKHRITLTTYHSNQYVRADIEFREESWDEKNSKWTWSGGMLAIRNEGSCP